MNNIYNSLKYIIKTDKKERERMIYNRFYFVFDKRSKKNLVKQVISQIFQNIKFKVNYLNKSDVSKNFIKKKSKHNKKTFKIFAITFEKNKNIMIILRNLFKEIVNKIDISKKEMEIINFLLQKKTK